MLVIILFCLSKSPVGLMLCVKCIQRKINLLCQCLGMLTCGIVATTTIQAIVIFSSTGARVNGANGC